MTMSEAAPRAVVAGHAGFAAALVDAVGRIAGRADAFRAVSNDGLDAAGIESAIRGALADLPATVVFTDLPAGSCTMAARKIARTDPRVSVVTGASLAMLLEFAMGEGTSAAALQRAATRGREAALVFPATGARVGD
jgi:PTS system N-acetylgalactosamine-specific IIA component